MEAAVQRELSAARGWFAAVWFQARRHAGVLTPADLQWLVPILERDRANSESPELLKAIKALSAVSPTEFALLRGNPSDVGRGLTVKTYDLPFLQSQVGTLAICSLSFQQSVLEVATRISLFNQQVEYLRSQEALTFDSSLSSENHRVVRDNLKAGYQKLADQAKRVIEQINKCIPE